jgi:hypothetical protein
MAPPEVDPSVWLATRGCIARGVALNPPAETIPPAWPYPPSHLSLEVEGLPVHLLRGPSTLPHDVDDAEIAAFLSILDHLIGRERPDALLAHEADRLAAESLRRGRSATAAPTTRAPSPPPTPSSPPREPSPTSSTRPPGGPASPCPTPSTPPRSAPGPATASTSPSSTPPRPTACPPSPGSPTSWAGSAPTSPCWSSPAPRAARPSTAAAWTSGGTATSP